METVLATRPDGVYTDCVSDEEDSSFWGPILEGERDPIHIIYVALDKDENVDLSDLEEFGLTAMLWTISEVTSCEEALDLNSKDPADVFVILNGSIKEAKQISKACPQMPIVLARSGGFADFDFDKFPPQVLVACWAAPRPGEFMDSIGDALGKVATEIIYEATRPQLIVPVGFSEELMKRLAAFPQERFRLNPRVFEETVAELLRRMGYETILTPRSGDHGRDVIASLKTPTAQMLMLVECKRFAANRLVGPEPIARIWIRLFDDKANMAMVVTTSDFQPVAKREATSKGYQLSLKHGEEFMEWVRQFGVKQ